MSSYVILDLIKEAQRAQTCVKSREVMKEGFLRVRSSNRCWFTWRSRVNSEHLPKEKQHPCVCLLTLFLFVPPQSYSEPVDVKTSQPPQLINSKPPSVFPGPSQAHSALYLSSHYHQQPGMNPHLTTMHPSLPRSIAPKANNQMPVTVSIANMAVSPAPPLQISPPLHQHLNMQQPLGTQLPMQVQPALHSPTMQQVRATPRRALDSPSEVLEGLFIQRGWGGGLVRSSV